MAQVAPFDAIKHLTAPDDIRPDTIAERSIHMKTARLITPLTIALLLTASVIAQEVADTSNPKDLLVVEKSWRKELLDPKRNTNPLRPNEELMSTTRQQKEFLKNRDNALPNQPTEPRMPAPPIRSVTPAREMWEYYVYEIKVQNVGEKTIKQIDWAYQFLDPDTQLVKEQRKIASRVKLAPGKTQVIEQRSTRKPTVVVNANQLGKKYRDQFTERAVITRIVYTDGSAWRRRPE